MIKTDLKNQINKIIEKKIGVLSDKQLIQISDFINALIKDADTYGQLTNLLTSHTTTCTIPCRSKDQQLTILHVQNILLKLLSSLTHAVSFMSTLRSKSPDFKEFVADFMDSTNVLIDSLEHELNLRYSPKISIETVCPEGFSFTENKFYLYLVLSYMYIQRTFTDFVPDYISCTVQSNDSNRFIEYIINVGKVPYTLHHTFDEVLKSTRLFIINSFVPSIINITEMINARLQHEHTIPVYTSIPVED